MLLLFCSDTISNSEANRHFFNYFPLMQLLHYGTKGQEIRDSTINPSTKISKVTVRIYEFVFEWIFMAINESNDGEAYIGIPKNILIN